MLAKRASRNAPSAAAAAAAKRAAATRAARTARTEGSARAVGSARADRAGPSAPATGRTRSAPATCLAAPGARRSRQDRLRKTAEEEGAETCPVCLEPLAWGFGRQKTLGCGHVLHSRCVLEWRRQGTSGGCPCCRQECGETLSLPKTYAALDAALFDSDSPEGSSKAFKHLHDIVYVLEPRNAPAKGFLAYMYLTGCFGCKIDKARAVSLYTTAHELGDASSSMSLAEMYRNGDGVPVNKKRAVQLLSTAHARGHEEATLLLAQMYRDGEGTPANERRALEIEASVNLEAGFFPWEQKDPATRRRVLNARHELGDVDATMTLANMYTRGIDVPVDESKALGLYTAAHERGELAATRVLVQMYLGGEGTEDGERDERKAAELLEVAHERGDLEATTRLAALYRRGEGIPADASRALALYAHAHAAGVTAATAALAEMHRDGEGTGVDRRRALELFTAAHQNGDADATAFLAELYGSGNLLTMKVSKPEDSFLSLVRNVFSRACLQVEVCQGSAAAPPPRDRSAALERGCQGRLPLPRGLSASSASSSCSSSSDSSSSATASAR